jgi:hypothetical protein
MEILRLKRRDGVAVDEALIKRSRMIFTGKSSSRAMFVRARQWLERPHCPAA